LTGSMKILGCLMLMGALLFAEAAQAQSGIRTGGRDVNLSDREKEERRRIPTTVAINHREQMRRLIIKISKFTREVDKNFIVLTRGGLDLIEKSIGGGEDAVRSVASTYMKAIDGIILRNVFFQPSPAGQENYETGPAERAKILRLAKFAQRRGLQIWVTDYAPTAAISRQSHEMNKASGFIPFTVDHNDSIFNSVPEFPVRPAFENAESVTGLRSAQNFLYMTDSSLFDTQDEMVEHLSGTNFDALVVDVFHRGRDALTAKNVRRLQLKKIGSRRLVLAYMNISTADTSRYYWKSGWTVGNPRFIGSPSPGSADLHFVQYWDRAWHDIMTGTPESYAYGITQQGFDGIILDGVDNYRFFETAESDR